MAFSILLATLLALNGATADTLPLVDNWRFRPDSEDVGLNQAWHDPEHPDADWAVVRAGERWEDQDFAEIDGVAWYRRWVDVPKSWVGRTLWFAAGALNDAGTLYCNGKRVNDYGDHETRSMADKPVIADLTRFLKCGESNLLALRAFDWGASGGLWRLPCVLTTEAGRLPLDSLLVCYPEAETGRLDVELDLSALGNERPEAKALVELEREDGTPLATREAPVPRDAFSVALSLPLPQTDAPYRVRTRIQGPGGEPLAGIVASREVRMPAQPAWPQEYGALEIRNNFVTELLAVASVGADAESYTFSNPREGWVFFAVRVAHSDAGRAPTALLDDRTDPLVWRTHPKTGALEAMQYLAEGEHRLSLGNAAGARLDVRTMPEIAFCYYPSARHIESYGPYDWEYMERHVLCDVNAVISRRAVPRDQFDQWRREGRTWIANAGLPGLGAAEAPPAYEVFRIWAGNAGATQPGYAGMMVDEFLWAGAAHYAAWGEAVRRLDASPGFEGRTFYAWCGDLFGQTQSLAFSRVLMDLGHRFSWERYLSEEPSEEKARRRITREIRHRFGKWKEALPGVERHMVLCLGYLSAPPETLNLNPSVDYHVYLDMQFQHLATDPAYWGLYGIMEYMAAYADEESLLYAQKLFRHYCIEGQRTRLNSDPYILPHLKNPDFADGLRGWEVGPAEAGGIDVKQMEGFSWLEGRYPRTREGDRFCWMKRSAAGPNRVSQTINALEPGRLYSVKLISADRQHLDQKQQLAVCLDVADAETVEEYGFQFVYPSCYSHVVEPYTRDHPAYMNFHRAVFRATGTSAVLTISDWASPAEPGGPVGQEIAFNFVEVQPFHEP